MRLPIYPGPLRSTWVPRPRLQAVLSDAANEGRPIVMVSAPAGAGKSVLARQWLEVDTREHLEIALTPDLDEGALLLHTVVGALETVGVPAPNLQASITSAQPRLSTVVIPALERLLATRTRPFVLVLDDVHVLQDQFLSRHPARAVQRHAGREPGHPPQPGERAFLAGPRPGRGAPCRGHR